MRVDLNSEIPLLDIPRDIRLEQDKFKQRNDLMDWIDGRAHIDPMISATALAVEDPHLRTMILEASRRLETKDGQSTIADRELIVELRTRLATVSGRPLASPDTKEDAHLRGVKVGQRALPSRGVRELERRGGEVNILRSFPADFSVDLVLAHKLLSMYGWRIAINPQNWILYEIGGGLEQAIHDWLVEQAAEKDDQKLLDRATVILGGQAGQPRRKGRA